MSSWTKRTSQSLSLLVRMVKAASQKLCGGSPAQRRAEGRLAPTHPRCRERQQPKEARLAGGGTGTWPWHLAHWHLDLAPHHLLSPRPSPGPAPMRLSPPGARQPPPNLQPPPAAAQRACQRRRTPRTAPATPPPPPRSRAPARPWPPAPAPSQPGGQPPSPAMGRPGSSSAGSPGPASQPPLLCAGGRTAAAGGVACGAPGSRQAAPPGSGTLGQPPWVRQPP